MTAMSPWKMAENRTSIEPDKYQLTVEYVSRRIGQLRVDVTVEDSLTESRPPVR